MSIIRLTKKDGTSMLLSTDEIRKVERIRGTYGQETVISLRNNTALYVQEDLDEIQDRIIKKSTTTTLSFRSEEEREQFIREWTAAGGKIDATSETK